MVEHPITIRDVIGSSPVGITHQFTNTMDKLDQEDLQNYWKLYFESYNQGDDDAAITCFDIDNEYKSRYGEAQFIAWVNYRTKSY